MADKAKTDAEAAAKAESDAKAAEDQSNSGFDATIGMNVNKNCWKFCSKQEGDCVSYCGTGGKCCKLGNAIASCSGSEGPAANYHGCVAGPSEDAKAAAAAKTALEAAEAARIQAEAAQAVADAAAASASQASADAAAAAAAKTALEAAQAARIQEEAAKATSDAAAAAAAQASTDAKAAAAAKDARETAEATRLQAEARQAVADAAAASAAQASAEADATAAQAQADTDAAAAEQAKAESEAEAAADLDVAAAQAKANIEAKAKAEAEAEAERERSAGSAGSASSGGSGGSDSDGNSGCVDMDSNNDSDDTIAVMDNATKTKLMALDITLDVHFRRNLVIITITGPSQKWIGVSFGATVMAENPYTIVWEANKVSERLLREYSAGLILKNSSMTYIESCYKTNPLRRQLQSTSDTSIRKNTCMRPIAMPLGGSDDTVDTYYSFAKLKGNGGTINFMLAIGHTKSFGYHSNIFTGVLTFPAPPPEASTISIIDKTSFAWSVWIVVVLVLVVIILIAVILCWKYFASKKTNAKDLPTNAKDLPAVANTVDIEMSTCTNPAAAPKIADPLDDFRSNHRIDHQVVEMSASSAMAKNIVDTMFGAGTVANTRDDGTQVIHLNDWKLAGGNVAIMYLPFFSEDSIETKVETQLSVSRSRLGSRKKKLLKVSRKQKSLKRGGSSGDASLIMLCLLVSLFCNGSVFCNAHNWLNNPTSRASKTSIVTPCPPADLSRPAHMQVGMNQDFEVEFMSGHSYTNTYFAIIRHEDENKLKYHSESMFQKYIANAPEDATVPAPERTHVGCSKTVAYSGWEKMLEPSDPEYIHRPGAFFGKHCEGGLRQFKYTSNLRKNDIFTSYTNSKWPWLVGVYRFKHGKSFPDEFDTVRLKIPERTGTAGRHILHYVW